MKIYVSFLFWEKIWQGFPNFGISASLLLAPLSNKHRT